MDKDCATIVIAACMRASRELGDIIHLINKDDENIKVAISTIIYDILQEIVEPLKNENVVLKDEIENRLEKYGRVF